jgi:hypothetical protein
MTRSMVCLSQIFPRLESYGYALILQSMKLAALYQANASCLLYTGTYLPSVVLVDIVLGHMGSLRWLL